MSPLHYAPEVQSGEYLGEDDIVRFEDRYGRSNPYSRDIRSLAYLEMERIEDVCCFPQATGTSSHKFNVMSSLIQS